MLVMFDVTDPCKCMTKGEGEGEVIDLKGVLARDEEFVRATIEALVRAALEAKMTEAIRRRQGRAQRAGCRPQPLLQPLADYPGWHAGAARAAGPYGAVFD
jgi:hypothetical protein